MAGLGAMCVIFLVVNLCINIVMIIDKFRNLYKYFAIAALVLCFLTWLFLTAGWGHYADKKGGVPSGDVDYGASLHSQSYYGSAYFRTSSSGLCCGIRSATLMMIPTSLKHSQMLKNQVDLDLSM